MICGNCKHHHEHVADVRACYKARADVAAIEAQLAASHHPTPTVGSTARTAPAIGTVAAGRYAVHVDGMLRFYKVDRPTEGKWAGRTFVKVYASDTTWPVKGATRDKVLHLIAQDPKAAMLRYGQEIGQCGHCGRTLTDETSRAQGVGPVCAERLGWASAEPRSSGTNIDGVSGPCVGGKCNGILQQCSKHSMQYQTKYGRAANE